MHGWMGAAHGFSAQARLLVITAPTHSCLGHKWWGFISAFGPMPAIPPYEYGHQTDLPSTQISRRRPQRASLNAFGSKVPSSGSNVFSRRDIQWSEYLDRCATDLLLEHRPRHGGRPTWRACRPNIRLESVRSNLERLYPSQSARRSRPGW